MIQLFAAVFACMCLGLIVAGLLQQAGIAAFKSPDSFASLFLATLSFQGAAWVLILIFLRRHEIPWRDAFGFHDEKIKAALTTAVKTVLVVLPVAWTLQYLSVTVLKHFGWNPENERAVDLIANARSVWLQVYLGFFAIVIGACCRGISIPRNPVSVHQTARLPEGGVVRREFSIRVHPSERTHPRATARVRPGPNLALRSHRQPARTHHVACALQRGQSHRIMRGQSGHDQPMNEFELIAHLTRNLPTNGSVVAGVGDDCAVLDLGIPDRLILFKTDAIVEGVHFTLTKPPEKIGHKALARCLSDIAAMAGTPPPLSSRSPCQRRLKSNLSPEFTTA